MKCKNNSDIYKLLVEVTKELTMISLVMTKFNYLLLSLTVKFILLGSNIILLEVINEHYYFVSYQSSILKREDFDQMLVLIGLIKY